MKQNTISEQNINKKDKYTRHGKDAIKLKAICLSRNKEISQSSYNKEVEDEVPKDEFLKSVVHNFCKVQIWSLLLDNSKLNRSNGQSCL